MNHCMHPTLTQRGRGGGAEAPTPQIEIKKCIFCKYDDIKVVPDLSFNGNQPLTSAEGQYIRILEKKDKRT